MGFRNYSIVFRRDGMAKGYAILARTKGLAIQQALEETDYELEDLIEVRDVFSAPQHDKFIPS